MKKTLAATSTESLSLFKVKRPALIRQSTTNVYFSTPFSSSSYLALFKAPTFMEGGGGRSQKNLLSLNRRFVCQLVFSFFFKKGPKI